MVPQLIGDGSTWETYSFEVEIPAAADNIKVIPLSGLGSSVGFDNITVELVLFVPLALDFAVGTAVSWEAESESNLYQPQKSSDNETWEDLGPVLMGNAVTITFDNQEAAFYRVLETPVAVRNVAVNGGFENADGDPMLAQGRRALGTQAPVRITTDRRSGMASMQIRVQNDDTPTASTCILQQNIVEAGSMITPGDTCLSGPSRSPAA